MPGNLSVKSSAGNESVQGIKTAMTLTRTRVCPLFGTRAIKTRVSESGLFLVLLASLLAEHAISRVSVV